MTDYRHVVVEELPDAPGPSDHKKEIDEAVESSILAANLYVAEPGQGIPFGHHRHHEQEELFYVLDGQVVFDVEDEEVTVRAGEALFVPPETFQGSRAAGDESARMLAIGAPRDALATTIQEYCETCDGQTERRVGFETDDGDRVATLTCAACGTETDRYVPGPEST